MGIDGIQPSQRAGADVTGLLVKWGAGDRSALDELMPLVFEELRQLARRHMRREVPGHTLQPTVLVHELFLRLTETRRFNWDSREDFFHYAAHAIRHLLVDYARARSSQKRGGRGGSIPLELVTGIAGAQDVDVVTLLALGEAVERLRHVRERAARLVDLRYFAGLTLPEAAVVLKVSVETLKKDWSFAKLWLARELRSTEAP